MQQPRTGRCQHCRQIRPLFKHENCWTFAIDPDDAWLCARDYSAREESFETGDHFPIRRDFDPFQAAEDWNTCEAILAASEKETQR